MQKEIKYISYEELKELPEVELIDVREPEERAIEHLGGKHIPLSELEENFSTLDTTKPIVVYCQRGHRSKRAAQLILDHLDVEDVYTLVGGVEKAR